MDQPSKVANPARGQPNRENEFSLSLYAPDNWSQETGSAIPFRVSLLILQTQAEYGLPHEIPPDIPARRLFIYLNCHTPSGQFRVNRITQLRTDDVDCRESAGTGPVVLKVVPVTGAAILQVTMDQLMCVSLFPHPLLDLTLAHY